MKNKANANIEVVALGAAERRGGERSEISRSGVVSGATGGALPEGASLPDPEVAAKPSRRRFSATYKLETLQAADACKEPGQIGELLRQRGLYSSHLTQWRKDRDLGALARLGRKRGRKAKPEHPAVQRVKELEREIARVRGRLNQAETIIDVQKKVSEILGIPLRSPDSKGND